MTKETEIEAAPELNSRQKKYLKGLGHSLSPVVSIGKDGLVEKIVTATKLELERHELIKAKIGKSSFVSKQETADFLTQRCRASLVQIIGKTILLYKKNPKLEKDKQIKIPK